MACCSELQAKRFNCFFVLLLLGQTVLSSVCCEYKSVLTLHYMEKALGTRLSYVNAQKISKMYFSFGYYDFYRHR